MRKTSGGLLVVALLVAGVSPTMAQTDIAAENTTMQASGTFDVDLTPQPSEEGGTPGRISIAKTFTGDLDGTSRGEMLTAMSAVEGSAAYGQSGEVVAGGVGHDVDIRGHVGRAVQGPRESADQRTSAARPVEMKATARVS